MGVLSGRSLINPRPRLSPCLRANKLSHSFAKGLWLIDSFCSFILVNFFIIYYRLSGLFSSIFLFQISLELSSTGIISFKGVDFMKLVKLTIDLRFFSEDSR